MPVMIVRTSAKSTLTSPGTVIRSQMPCTRLAQHVVGDAERLGERRAALDEVEQALVGDA